MRHPLVFVGKHPCDDMPYIVGTVPDPRSGHPAFTFDGPDYSGYYIRLPRWLARRVRRFWGGPMSVSPGLPRRHACHRGSHCVFAVDLPNAEHVWNCLDALSVERPPDCYDDGHGTHVGCGWVLVIVLRGEDE